MRADLRNALRGRDRTGVAGRALPLALVLAVLVVAAAGLAGTANFAGARWYPHGGVGIAHPHPPTVIPARPAPPRGVPRKRGAVTAPWLLTALIVLTVLLGAFLVWRWLRGRRFTPTAPEMGLAVAATAMVSVAPEPEPARVLTGIERALRALDEDREPADAVVRAWLGLQATAEESGVVRRESETPTEFAARVLASVFSDAQPLRTLLRLYLRTRFGDRPVTADDVAAARDALEQLLASWQATDGRARTTVR